MSTLANVLNDIVKKQPHKVALQSEDRPDITFSDLQELSLKIAFHIHQHGVNTSDRVACFLDDRFNSDISPLFFGVSHVSQFVPLNPGVSVNSVKEQLIQLKVNHVLLASDNNELNDFCQQHGINIIRIAKSVAETVSDLPSYTEGTSNGPEDVALVLQTSGTTSKPKTMQLRQRHVVAVARAFINSLGVDENDKCLNVMPMFHYHGLIIASLTALLSGGTIVCIKGFNKDDFLNKLIQFQPTWYTAVSGIHAEVLRVAKSNVDKLDQIKLRFIRSSSHPLLPHVLEELESLFNSPIVESYGASEIGTVACNPVDRQKRKCGSVGLPVPGVSVRIIDDNGQEVSKGSVGEVIAQGPALIDGYEEASKNIGAFENGWFFTGDLGYFDEDGFLFLKGRVKELIKKGKDRIVPFELDVILNQHPDVIEGCIFSIPSKRFGEEVAAVVVKSEKSDITDKEIMDYMAEHVPQEKVPALVHFSDQIPKNPIGKPQRIGMAGILSLEAI